MKRKSKTKKTATEKRIPRIPILTPYALRMELASKGLSNHSPLDRLLNDDEARVLEDWAICAQLIEGRAKTTNYSGGGTRQGMPSPIPDAWIYTVQKYMVTRSALRKSFQLQVLDAFSALQNNDQGALSIAGYGVRLYPCAKNKRDAFLVGIAESASVLVDMGH